MHSLRQLNYVLSVWRERSFIGAAGKLNISQPAISGQVRQLEEDLGFKVFERTPQGVDVTELGRQFLIEAEKVQNASINLSETIDQLRGGVAGPFTVGLISGIADNILPILAPSVEKFKPVVRLELVTTTTQRIHRLLLEGRLDIGFTIESDNRLLSKELTSKVIARDRLVAIVSSNRPNKFRDGLINIEALAEEPLIMSEMSVGYGELIMSLFKQRNVRPNIMTISDNVETTEALIRAGRGIALVPRKSAELSHAALNVNILEFKTDITIEFSLVRLNQALSVSGKQRIDSILSRFSSQIPERHPL
jgi:DNA-binding transcriptional LysR family regulator